MKHVYEIGVRERTEIVSTKQRPYYVKSDIQSVDDQWISYRCDYENISKQTSYVGEFYIRNFRLEIEPKYRQIMI